jgi:hypothetical protein
VGQLDAAVDVLADDDPDGALEAAAGVFVVGDGVDGALEESPDDEPVDDPDVDGEDDIVDFEVDRESLR